MSQQETSLQIAKKNMPEFMAIMRLNTSKDTDVEALVLNELDNLNNIFLTKPDLAKCDPESIKYCIKRALKNNLTLDPASGLMYVQSRKIPVTVSRNGQDVTEWMPVMEVNETAAGLISLNRQIGRIYDIKNPTIIFNEDETKVEKVIVEILVPSVGNTSRWEAKEFKNVDFQRWKAASHRQNAMPYNRLDASKKEAYAKAGKIIPDNATLNMANPLYTSFYGGIDSEFAVTKAIRHTLNPKRLGTNANEKYVRANIQTIDISHIEINKEKDMAAANEESVIPDNNNVIISETPSSSAVTEEMPDSSQL